MPECAHCGGHVTPQYAKVFAPDGMDQPRTCPDCELLRENGDIREKH